MANEQRLIDLDKIKPTDFPSCEMDGLDVVRYLETLPTVDAVEVVHGRWEDDGTCSNCKGLNPTYRANKWSAEFPDFPGHFDHLNYCPNCGAKMDAKE